MIPYLGSFLDLSESPECYRHPQRNQEDCTSKPGNNFISGFQGKFTLRRASGAMNNVRIAIFSCMAYLRANFSASGSESRRGSITEQAMEFFFDYVVAFTSVGLQSRSIKCCNVTPAVTDQTRTLQIPSGFRDAFAAYAEHAGNQFLCHGQFIRWQSIEG
jgi:hypothetical protein